MAKWESGLSYQNGHTDNPGKMGIGNMMAKWELGLSWTMGIVTVMAKWA